MRLLLILAGSAIGFAVPLLAQEQNTVSPEVRQQIEEVLAKYEDAYNKRDAAAIAALYTADAAEVFEKEEAGGSASGRETIYRGMPPTSHRVPANCRSSLFRCMQSVRTYAPSRNSVLVFVLERVTTPRSLSMRAMTGRSAWPIPIDRGYCAAPGQGIPASLARGLSDNMGWDQSVVLTCVIC